jgi:chorismate mutase
MQVHVHHAHALELEAVFHAQTHLLRVVFDHAPVLVVCQHITHNKILKKIISFILRSQDKLEKHFASLNLCS